MQKQDPYGVLIDEALALSPDRGQYVSSVTVYEMLDGVLALIELRKKVRRDVPSAFQLLESLLTFLEAWTRRMLPYDARVDSIYQSFPPRLRQELKEDARIAAVALARGASVWTCNVRDYARVPGLAVVDARTGLQAP